MSGCYVDTNVLHKDPHSEILKAMASLFEKCFVERETKNLNHHEIGFATSV